MSRSCRRTGVIAVAALTVVAVLATRGPAQEKQNPIIGKVKAAVKDSTKPFTLVIHLHVEEGTGPKLEAAFAPAARATRKEKGCLVYELNRDPNMPTDYLVYERWRNLHSLEAHLKSAHTTALLKEIGGIASGPPEFQILVPASD
jgi:quinol monooxygenase YgiN